MSKTPLTRDTRHRMQLQLPWSPGRTMSVVDVAAKLQCSEDTVRRMLEAGELQGYQLRKIERSPWRVYADSVAKLIGNIIEENALEEYSPPTAPARPAGLK